ncbi:MAG: hypothetical protein AAGA85_28310 [Bacteroidota bacterium]
MKTIKLFLCLAFLALFISCGDDDDIDPSEQRLTTGYLVYGANDDGTTIFVRYFEDIPSGTVDLTEGQAFQNFFLIDVYDGAFWTQQVAGDNGFSKMAVNGNGVIVEEGVIPTTGANAFVLRIRDSNTGIFIDPNDFTQVRVFDPSDLSVTGNIDLSEAPLFEERAELGFGTSSAVIRGDDVFVSYAQGAGPLLDNFTLIRGSISNGTLGNQVNSTTGPTFTFNPLYRLTDEQGNLYIHHTGNLTPAPGSNIGGVLKIPPGSNEFDPSYDFRVVGDPALLLHSMRAFSYYQNGIAYAHVGLETPQAVVDVLVAAGGVQNLSDEQINQILFLLNTSENAGIVELDLNAQTVRELPDMPRLNPFAATNAYWIDDVPYFPIVNTTENGVYKYDPATDQTSKVFDVTGATVTAIVDLSANNNR